MGDREKDRRIMNLQTELQNYIDKNKNLNQNNEKLIQEIETLKKQNIELKSNAQGNLNKELNQRIMRLQNQIQEMLRKKEETESELENLKKIAQTKEKDKRIMNLQNELMESKNKIQKEKEEKNNLEIEINNLIQKLENVNKKPTIKIPNQNCIIAEYKILKEDLKKK